MSGDSQVAQLVKNLPASVEDTRDTGSIPGSGRSPEGGHGIPLRILAWRIHTQRSLEGYSPWSCKESDTPEHRLTVLTQWGQKAGPLPTSLLRSVWTLVNWMKCCIHVLYQVPRDRRFPSFRSCYSPGALRVAVLPLILYVGKRRPRGCQSLAELHTSSWWHAHTQGIQSKCIFKLSSNYFPPSIST